MKLRHITIHRSLIRPLLLGGGERKLVMSNYTLIITLLFGAGLNFLTIIAAIILATIGHFALTKLANYDPQLSTIYLRYRRYQNWYPAQSNLCNTNHPVVPAIAKGLRL